MAGGTSVSIVSTTEVEVGDRVRFLPGPRERAWWEVTAKDKHHIVAVRQAAFHPKGVVEYTVTAIWEHRYNGQGPGLVRSSLNTLGGGWNLEGRVHEGSEEILAALRGGDFEISQRRVVAVAEIEKAAR